MALSENEMIWKKLEEHKEAFTSLSEQISDLYKRVESLEAAIVASLNLFEPKKRGRRR